MKEHAFRLKKGDDLKGKIEEYVKEKCIKAGVVLCAVGSLSEAVIRCADGKTAIKKTEPLEIVSFGGTVSNNGCHLHISVADSNLSVFGGHLKEGCIINTTSEVVLQELENFKFDRVFDSFTGYDELVVINNKD